MLDKVSIIRSTLDSSCTGAIQTNDGVARYKNGKLHNEDGPALILAKNNWKMQYFVEGKEISTQIYEQIVKAVRIVDLDQFLKSSSLAERLLAEKRRVQLDQQTKFTIHTKDGIYYNATADFYKQLSNKKVIHNDNGPAVESSFNSAWYKDGLLHRIDGPALFCFDGTHEEWYINGLLHRDFAPARTHNSGSYEWYQHGQLHREDGPAIRSIINGEENLNWCIRDEELLEQTFNNIINATNLEELSLYLTSPSAGERYLAEKQVRKIRGLQ